MREVSIYLKGSYYPLTESMRFMYLIKEGDRETLRTGDVNKKGSPLEAEYLGLLKSLEYIKGIKKDLKYLKIFSTNQIMVRQMKGEYRIQNPEMRSLFTLIHQHLSSMEWEIIWIPKDRMNEVFTISTTKFYENNLKDLLDSIDMDEEDVWV